MEDKEQHSKSIIAALLILLVGVSIGYAMLSTTLLIKGDAVIKKATWDIHFDNVQIDSGSVAINSANGEKKAEIKDSIRTLVEYNVVLNNPGDYYEFTVDVVNSGTMDAKISNVNLSGIEGHEKYFTYSVVWDDNGETPAVNDVLEQGQSRKVRVKVQYDPNVTGDDLPTQDQTLELEFSMNYVQAK